MPKFNDETAVEIAYGDDKVVAFEEKHPECIVNITKMSPKDSKAWLDKNPKADAGDRAKVKNLYAVELDDVGKEKLVVIMSPISQKILDIYAEKSEAPVEEED